MLRTARKVTPILHALLLGAMSVTTVAATATVLAGCEDESKPEYYIKRLDDPVHRTAAIKRLVQFYEDSMTRADKNRDDPGVKEVLNKIVPSLTKTYLTVTLDDRNRLEVIKVLADSRDTRAKAAWIKALKDFQPNVGEEEIKYAARAISKSDVRDADAMDAMISAFMKLEAGSKNGGLMWMDFKDSMTDVSSPSWKAQLIDRLTHPIEMVGQKDKDQNENNKIAAYRNEQFWQVTAAEILGNIKAGDAVKPLLKCIIDPSKADVAPSAVMSIAKIGKDAMPVLNAAVQQQDKELNTFAGQFAKNNPEIQVVRTAALVIGTIGRADGIKALLTALDTKDDVTRAVLARELSKLPTTPESLKAYIDVLSKMPLSVDIPPGYSAVPELTDKLAQFYDSNVIDMLIKRGKEAKGSEDDKNQVRDNAMTTMIKLMKLEQADAVEKAINDWSKDADDNKLEKEAFKKAKELLKNCTDKAECYLAKLEEPAVQVEKDHFVGVKAAYMLGILGNNDTRAKLVDRIGRIKHAAIKFAAGEALDHLAPNGDKAAADGLKKIIDDDKAKGDRNLMAGDAPLKHIMIRLQARM